MLIIDLGVFHHEAHVVKFREVFSWSVIWVALTVVFGFLFGEFAEYRFAHDARLLTTAGFNRRMRKTACPVVWKAHGGNPRGPIRSRLAREFCKNPGMAFDPGLIFSDLENPAHWERLQNPTLIVADGVEPRFLRRESFRFGTINLVGVFDSPQNRGKIHPMLARLKVDPFFQACKRPAHLPSSRNYPGVSTRKS